MRAHKAAIPANLFQICGTRGFIGKKRLKFPQGTWKWQFLVLENIHHGQSEYTPNLYLVGVCVNRIGKEETEELGGTP
jgi:hypothetical protein